MPAFARNSALVALLLLLSSEALATEGIYLPPAPTGPGGEDSIETENGTRCRQSINSNGPYMDVGAAGSAARPIQNDQHTVFTDQRDQEGMLYVRVTIPLGSRPKRLDCSRLYELEIQRLKREVELLKMSAE